MRDKNWKVMFDSSWKREGPIFIQFLLDTGLDVNALNKFGGTMLSYAAERGNLQMAEFLAQKGVDVNVSNSDGSKPLHIAAQYGRKDLVKFFLNRGISVDSCDKDKCTPLHYLAAKSDISSAGFESYQELVHILVDRNADINAMDKKGCTPLLLAAQTSRKHMVEQFIKLGANLEICDEDQFTVLHHACRIGWSGIVRTLVEGRFEIDLNAKTLTGCTPADIAAQNFHEDIVKLLVESGADVESRGSWGYTLLHHYCIRGSLEMVRSLVSKECDLNAKTEWGNTPLLEAVSNSHLIVAEYLIECGADVKCCDDNGLTVLHHACNDGLLEMVKSFVSKGCDINAKDYRGRTPLMSAVEFENLRVIKYLIKYGADVECCNRSGWTVLHHACRNGWLGVVKLLTKKKCNVNALTRKHNTTPLHLVTQKYNNLTFIKHLLNAGADCNVVNSQGETAFNMFVRSFVLYFVRNRGATYLKVIILFLRSGAHFQSSEDYAVIRNFSFLKRGILQNAQLCTVVLLNKFNNADLPKIYDIPSCSEILPRIEELKIASKSIIQGIAESVKFEIQTNGYCNVLNARPIVLRMLCALSLLKHYYS